MGQFVINFFINNLILVLLVSLFFIILSFKFKAIRKFVFVMSFLIVGSLSIYYLHELNLVNNSLYFKTLEFVCLMMHMFEMTMSLIFSMQIKVMENITYYNLVILLVYIIDVLCDINVNINMFEQLFISGSTSLKIKFINTIKLYLYNIKFIPNLFNKNIVVMNC